MEKGRQKVTCGDVHHHHISSFFDYILLLIDTSCIKPIVIQYGYGVDIFCILCPIFLMPEKSFNFNFKIFDKKNTVVFFCILIIRAV